MYCPTCASPLPVGAMFCGECGRAVSSADLAAARRRADAAAAHVDAASASEPPPAPVRPTVHPRRQDAEPPWWVRDRQPRTSAAEVGADDARPVAPAAVPEPPAWPVGDEPVEAEPSAIRSTAPEEARVESPRDSRPVSPPSPASPGDAIGSVLPEPAAPPAPLRSPSRHPDNGPRPTSAPLWTASLTPVAADDPSSATEVVRPSSDEEADQALDDGGAPTEADPSAVVESALPTPSDETPDHDGDSDRDGAEARSASAEHAPAADPVSTPGRADVASDPVKAPPLVHPTADAPRDGDTAPVAALGRDFRPPTVGASGSAPVESDRPAPVPLVEPVPLVQPGSALVPERCTHCGASIGEDDIFCGECGAVVQSVALSFTGPVVPLPPEWRPDDESVLNRRPVAGDGHDDGARPGTDDAVTGPDEPDAGDAAPAPGATDGQRPASPRRAPEPIDHVPGFRAERPAVTPRPTVADVPPAPPSSSAPPWRPRRPPVDLPDDDDVDETRIVRRGALGAEFVLQFSTGESITIDGTGLVGRAPSPQPGERFDQLVRIVDPGKSVSKTHLEFGQEAGVLWISDRWSGNGTVVRPRDLPPRRADPGVRVRVTRGTRVEIGEQFFVVV